MQQIHFLISNNKMYSDDTKSHSLSEVEDHSHVHENIFIVHLPTNFSQLDPLLQFFCVRAFGDQESILMLVALRKEGIELPS